MHSQLSKRNEYVKTEDKHEYKRVTNRANQCIRISKWSTLVLMTALISVLTIKLRFPKLIPRQYIQAFIISVNCKL